MKLRLKFREYEVTNADTVQYEGIGKSKMAAIYRKRVEKCASQLTQNNLELA